MGSAPRANLAAHGVSFAEAATVLDDDFALTRRDPDAVDEQRFVSLGLSDLGRLLVVVYTYREPDTVRADLGVEGEQTSKSAI